MDADIIVCGGSLAGSACAIRLKQLGHHPLVLEKSRFPRPKLCGEFLGPDAFPLLKQLGVWETIRHHAWGPVERVHFFNRDGQKLSIRMCWMDAAHPYGLALSREILDHLLLTQAKGLGVSILENHRVLNPIATDHSGFLQEFLLQCETHTPDHATRIQEVKTSWLVDATGRNGQLSLDKSPGKKNLSKDTIGIQCHVKLPIANTAKDLHMFLFDGGYGGLQPIGADTANLCMLLDAKFARAVHRPFDDFVRGTIGRNRAAARVLDGAARDGDFHTTANLNMNLDDKDPDLLRIGDALITVDPFTGSGMAHALETGVLAAEALDAAIRKKKNYTEALTGYRQRYHQRFQNRLRAMRMVRPLLQNTAVHTIIWPLLPPVLPALARVLR